MMMVWSRVKCAWVAWTGTRAAWLALPAASALMISACIPVAGLLRDMPLGPAHISMSVASARLSCLLMVKVLNNLI
jgi:hypothetical protein